MAKRKADVEEQGDVENVEDVEIVPEVVEEDPEAVEVEVSVIGVPLLDTVWVASNTLKQIARGLAVPDVPPVLETMLPNDAVEGQRVLLMDWRSFRIYAVRSNAGWSIQPELKH